MKYLLRAIRAPFLTATLVPVLVGAADAARKGFFDIFLFVLVLFGAASFHMSANVLNDYFDYRGGTDNINRYHNPFSGGSRLIQDGIYTPKRTLILGLISLILGIAIGIYLMILTDPLLFVFGAVGTILVLTYSIERIGLSYIGRGLGEITVAAAFGPLMVLGTYYVMAGGLSLSALYLSIPVALLIALVLLVNGYPDFEADAKTKKYTVVVSFGREKTRYIYAALMGAVFLVVIIGVSLRIIPALALVSLFVLPVGLIAIKKLFLLYEDPRGVVAVCGMTVFIHLVTGLLLAAGVFMYVFI